MPLALKVVKKEEVEPRRPRPEAVLRTPGRNDADLSRPAKELVIENKSESNRKGILLSHRRRRRRECSSRVRVCLCVRLRVTPQAGRFRECYWRSGVPEIPFGLAGVVEAAAAAVELFRDHSSAAWLPRSLLSSPPLLLLPENEKRQVSTRK